MTNQTPNFHALLIGIDFYFPHQLPDGHYKNLRGCVRDINDIETYLKDTFNLKPEQIIKLTATASDNPNQPQEPPEILPTYENIVAKFKQLTAKAKPQDIVYIHYSGHGGRAKTIYENIKGFAALDEALVPTDIGQPNSRYLRDIEFAKLLEEMVAKQLAITLVLDSCHSGGATRELQTKDYQVRGGGFIDTTPRPRESLVAPIQELAQNWQNLTENTRNITVINGLLPEPKGYTLIAACRDNESAIEWGFGNAKFNGILTYFLLKALREFGPEIHVKDLFNRISHLVYNCFKQQTPMLLGETQRTFFGGQSAIVSHHPTVMQVDISNNRVQIQMGEAKGIKTGAKFDIFKFRTRDFNNPENRLATVQVVEVEASNCWAEITQIFGFRTINNQLTEGMIEIGSPAVYLSPGLKQIRKIKVILPDSLPQIPGVNVALLPAILATKKEQFKGHSWIEFSSEDENIDYFVSLNSAGEYQILDSNKQPLKNIIFPIKIDETEATKKLINRLIHIARYQSIVELENEDAFERLNGKLKLQLAKSENQQFIPFETEDKLPILEAGEENLYLLIHNQSTRSLNITALTLQPNWSIIKIYPNGAPYEVVEPGQQKVLNLRCQLPENYQEGVEIIKVFATVDGTDFKLLELPPLDQSPKKIGNQTPTNTLEKLLSAVVDEDTPQRKIKVENFPCKKWTTEKVEFVLLKKSLRACEESPPHPLNTLS